jgi:hypothetical protein
MVGNHLGNTAVVSFEVENLEILSVSVPKASRVRNGVVIPIEAVGSGITASPCIS